MSTLREAPWLHVTSSPELRRLTPKPRHVSIFGSEPPIGGRQKGHPDLFRFPRFLPICSVLRSWFLGIPRFLLICSDFFRCLLIRFQNKSENIKEIPFCRPLLQVPDQSALQHASGSRISLQYTKVELIFFDTRVQLFPKAPEDLSEGSQSLQGRVRDSWSSTQIQT